MKKLFTLFIVVFSAMLINAQVQVIDNFDTQPDSSFWNIVMSENADPAVSFLHYTYVNDPVEEGTGAFQIEYSIHNIEPWGGFAKFEHWNPDTNAYFDFSHYKDVSFWYYNAVPQDSAGRVHLRLQFYDASDSPTGANTYTSDDTELYYSFHYILDMVPGWNHIVMPMEADPNYWNGEGFNLTGWAGIPGNGVLDLDKIKGYGLEFSVSGGGEGDHVTGTIVLDLLALEGAAEDPWLMFNGFSLDPSFGQFTWGQSTIEIVEGGGEDPATNAIKWVQGDEWSNGWSGGGWNIDPAHDLAFRWTLDSLKFKMKTTAGTGTIRLQMESGADGKIGFAVPTFDDEQWHSYAIPLTDYFQVDGTTNFDSSNIVVFQMMGEGNATVGKEVYFDYLWTGNPIIDLIAPPPPEGVDASPGTYSNIISWLDVPNETDETYNVYYSENPIADVNAEGVEVVKLGVEEGLQAVDHVLLAPATDQPVTYYYAVTCVDNFSNASDPGFPGGPVTNTAKGVTTIYPNAPTNFAADGDLSEWAGITPFRMFPSDGSGTVVTNTTIDGDADLSVLAYLAMDDDFMYVAFDVEDDVVNGDTTQSSYLVDSPDLFIGLYNWHGASHTSYQRGSEPDYHFRFSENQVILDNLGSAQVLPASDPNYFWGEDFPSGYNVEAKIAFADMAAMGGDDLFAPVVGMRIPIDYAINDNDEPGTNTRQGILTYSPNNEDQSWADVSRWTITWIGDQWTGVDNDETRILSYDLGQNYPNPFNPSTKIRFSLKEHTFVNLEVYNIIGQRVASIINKNYDAGQYEVNFNASYLPSGVYIYRIKAGSFVDSKKMLLLK